MLFLSGRNREDIRSGVSSEPHTTELTRVRGKFLIEGAVAPEISVDTLRQPGSDSFNAITEKLQPVISQTHLLSFLAEFQNCLQLPRNLCKKM